MSMKDLFREFISHIKDRVLIDHHKPVKQLLVLLLNVKSLNIFKVLEVFFKLY